VKFGSSDKALTQGWQWARKQALAYVFSGDPVGEWIEAALPGREAFCMRDVSHQSIGAQILGLASHVKNMLGKFAQNISPSRDWCSYWEINRYDLPAPVDYSSDQDFWYNLPANFDVLDCCYRQYLWTGDADYVQDPVFLEFYDRTVSDYVQRWDVNGDGLLEHLFHYGRRGLASYEEAHSDIRLGGDLLAVQVAACRAYAHIQELRGDGARAGVYRRKAAEIRALYDRTWWSEGADTFYSVMRSDESFDPDPNFGINCLALYYGLVQDVGKAQQVLDDLLRHLPSFNVEALSYLPEVAYRYGRPEAAYAALRRMIDPGLARREYPEISYSVIGTIVTGMMGVSCSLPGPGVPGNVVATMPRLTAETAWASLDGLALWANEVDVHHRGDVETMLRNRGGPALTWEARFAIEAGELLVDERAQLATCSVGEGGGLASWVSIEVPAGASRTVRVPAKE
jgi:hypothetical protein